MQTLAQYGVKENDMLLMMMEQDSKDISRRPTQPTMSVQSIESLRLQILNNSSLLSDFSRSEPSLAAVINDAPQFAQKFSVLEKNRKELINEKQKELAELHNNPFDIESQKKIEKIIQQEAIAENLQNAIEHNPECE